MSDEIRVFLADDQEICREGYSRLLENTGNIVVVGVASTAQEVRDRIIELKPDVLIIDLKWYGDDTAGVTAIREVKQAAPEVKIIAITVYEQLIPMARSAGADGALTKDFTQAQLLRILRQLVVRQVAFATAEDLPNRMTQLSPREFDVLRCLVQGLSDKLIASELHVAESTIKNHLQSIYSKLGAKNRAHAVSVAKSRNLV